MARAKTFDMDVVLDAAVGVFREHGFEGTSAQMLVDAMGIGRQSLYDTFGDKWQLYLAALRRYVANENRQHREALASGPRAIDGIRAMLARVVADAGKACLGVGSVTEFGCSRPEITQVNRTADVWLRNALTGRIRSAQRDGDVDGSLDPDTLATYLIASVAGIRLSARGGADPAQLTALGQTVLRALT